MNRRMIITIAVQCLPPGMTAETAQAMIDDFDGLLASCNQPGYEERIAEWQSRWAQVFKLQKGDEQLCSKCDGYGYLKSGNGTVEICECRKQGDTWQRSKKYESQLTEEALKIVLSAHRSRGAISKANLNWNYKTKALLLYGQVGTGKTVAGHVIVREWISRLNIPAHYISTERISASLKAQAYGDESKKASAGEYLLNAQKVCRESGIIFIDDLCAERLTDACAQEISDLIRSLYERRAYCVLTTNAGSNGIGNRYGKDVLDRIMDERWMTHVDTGNVTMRRG